MVAVSCKLWQLAGQPVGAIASEVGLGAICGPNSFPPRDLKSLKETSLTDLESDGRVCRIVFALAELA